MYTYIGINEGIDHKGRKVTMMGGSFSRQREPNRIYATLNWLKEHPVTEGHKYWGAGPGEGELERRDSQGKISMKQWCRAADDCWVGGFSLRSVARGRLPMFQWMLLRPCAYDHH